MIIDKSFLTEYSFYHLNIESHKNIEYKPSGRKVPAP